jgi:hypothetical protein
MKKTDRETMINDVTNELLTAKFTQELGQKARVERSSIENEHMNQLREVISDVGRNLEEIGAVPKGMQYVGSLSVHIYKSEILRTAAFATVSETSALTFDLADAGLRELTGATLVSYGKTRKKLRSGF